MLEIQTKHLEPGRITLGRVGIGQELALATMQKFVERAIKLYEYERRAPNARSVFFANKL